MQPAGRGDIHSPMTPLSGLDAAFLYLETPETPMHVGSVHLYDVPRGQRTDFFERARRHVESRLHLTSVFRRRLATLPLELAGPMWVEDRPVDLDYHVRRIVLRKPGTMATLEARVAALHSELLDREHPLWMFYLIEGLASGQVAWYSKVHHASLDGAAGVHLANALLDPTPEPREVPRPRRRPLEATPSPGQLVRAALRNNVGQYAKLLRHVPELARVLGGLVGTAPDTWRGHSAAPPHAQPANAIQRRHHSGTQLRDRLHSARRGEGHRGAPRGDGQRCRNGARERRASPLSRPSRRRAGAAARRGHADLAARSGRRRLHDARDDGAREPRDRSRRSDRPACGDSHVGRRREGPHLASAIDHPDGFSVARRALAHRRERRACTAARKASRRFLRSRTS